MIGKTKKEFIRFEGLTFFLSMTYIPSRHGPDCPPVVVIVGDRTVRTVLLL